jgi:hypothetical protein
MRQELAGFLPAAESSELPLHRALAVEITAADVRQVDIARLASISETQLSHKLRGRKPISEDEAARIRAAIAELRATPA